MAKNKGGRPRTKTKAIVVQVDESVLEILNRDRMNMSVNSYIANLLWIYAEEVRNEQMNESGASKCKNENIQ